MSKVSITPVGGPEATLETSEPDEIVEGVKEWEDSIKTVQRDADVALLQKLLVERQTALDATGPRVTPDRNPLGAMTQKGFEGAIQAIKSAIAVLTNAPLAEIKYEGDVEPT